MGIYLPNIDYQFFGGAGSSGKEREFRIYNRFFEMALYGALRYFFPLSEEVAVSQVYSEKRDLPAQDPFEYHFPWKMGRRDTNVKVATGKVTLVDHSRMSDPEYAYLCYLVEYVDVIVGAISQALDFTTSGKDGCCEVAEIAYPVVERLTAKPFNPNSRYWKRYSISFFPKRKFTLADLLKGKQPPSNQFFTLRRLKLYQPEMIFDI